MKERLYLSLLIGLLLCVAGWTAHAQLSRTTPARQIWEYKTITLSRRTVEENWSSWLEDNQMLAPPVDGTAKRAELGREGWELVGAVTIADGAGGGTGRMVQFFKRSK